ncbi:Glycine cleavage system transcriptional activator [Falsiruegeria mediterranea M17]|uniref:Glycine cleavage system transcriptional activator n=2 Tax=Falsiruegeria TaxID=2854184 RepID=A0A2R8CCE1_9RHOB|nr:Glycine cleavage system transcriptional activator [Falsiruegeria mediterranea M17]
MEAPSWHHNFNCLTAYVQKMHISDMSRPLPPLNALRAFEAAGRHENFSRAAQELNVSHSAISRHVRGLEHRLGVALFRDLPRGLELTAEGRNYLSRVTVALDLISDATEDLGEAPEGRITVSSEPLFALKVLMPRLKFFYDAYPDVEVHVEATNALADVDRYEADIALRFAFRGVLDAPSDLISDTPLHVYAAPDLRTEGWRDPREVLQYRRFKDRGMGLWDRWGQLAGLAPGEVPDPRKHLETELAFEAAVQGLGVYLGAGDCVAGEVAAGRLIRCFDAGFRDGAMRLVQSTRARRHKAARAFREWLLEETSDLRGWPCST